MNEIGCLVLGLGCGAALGYALHSLVWWLRDQRALARWDAEIDEYREPPFSRQYRVYAVDDVLVLGDKTDD